MRGSGKETCFFFTVSREKKFSCQQKLQNNSIFTSTVRLGPIHRRINSQEVTVLMTDSTVQKSRE